MNIGDFKKFKDKIFKCQGMFVFLVFLFSVILLLFVVKGLDGNPLVDDFSRNEWRDEGPFELSPERGRWGLLYAFAELESYEFDMKLGRFIAPDLAINQGKEYVSLFAPGLSFLLLPAYFIGKFFGISQFAVFFSIALFALANAVLVFLILKRLQVSLFPSLLASMSFIFGTTAFAYATTLYQHHVTTFFILLSLYLLIRREIRFWQLFLLWFLIASSITIDNPNIFLLFPVGVWTLQRTIPMKADGGKGVLTIFLDNKIFAIFAIILPLFLFGLYNNFANGSVTKLSGTLPAVDWISDDGQAVKYSDSQAGGKNKEALNFFKTRNMINGFYTLVFSADRGFLLYCPIMIFGFWGSYFLYKKNSAVGNFIAATVGLNLIIYFMWGDPYGGWAFGPRYLVPAFGLLSLAMGFWLERYYRHFALMTLWFIFFAYSSGVSSLGAVSTNMNPPRNSIIVLSEQTGKLEDYTFIRNFNYLRNKESKSFIYKEYLKDFISPINYWLIIFSAIQGLALFLIILSFKDKHYEKN